MHFILVLFVLIIAAPFILYAMPIIIYVVPFILVGLALSCMADFFRHHSTTARHWETTSARNRNHRYSRNPPQRRE